MLRQVASISAAFSIVAASVLTATVARAHGTFQECLAEAQAQYQKDLAGGMPRDAAAVAWKDAIDACHLQYHR